MEAYEITDLLEEAIDKLQGLRDRLHDTAFNAVERREENADEYDEKEDKLTDKFDDIIKDIEDTEYTIESLIEEYNDFANECENGFQAPEDDYDPYYDPEDEYDPLNR